MAINLEIVGKEFKTTEYEVTWQKCALYALGIGAQPDELDYLYENAKFKVYPTFAVIPAFGTLWDLVGVLKVNPMMILHGEQKIIMHKPIPKKAKIKSVPKVEAIYDKGKGAVVIVVTKSYLEDGSELFDNIFTIFCRGEGGFGGDRGPQIEPPKPPEGKDPDFAVENETIPIQALLYRLSGDYNPIHADPVMAKMGGFSKPILHGLCTYGFACRAIVNSICDKKPDNFKSFAARFSNVVYPGEKVITKGWKLNDTEYVIEAYNDKGEVVLTNGLAQIST